MPRPEPNTVSLAERLAAAIRPEGGRVLVAEDDPVGARVICALLGQLGYQYFVASNGADAWKEFDREPVRLVVSDWMMPEMNGLELCEKIRARSSTLYTYFILLTANHTSTENFALATNAGVDDFLTKPVDREALRMRLAVAERILKFTAEIRQLQELIPICAYCQRVRDENDYWQRVETYISQETGSKFSHGACPECCAKEIARFKQDEGGAVSAQTVSAR